MVSNILIPVIFDIKNVIFATSEKKTLHTLPTLTLSSPEPHPVLTFPKPLLASTGVSKRKLSLLPTNP